MRHMGIALAALLAEICTSKEDQDDLQATCYIVAPITPEPGNTATLDQQAGALGDNVVAGDLDSATVRQVQAAIARDRLRACWLRFDWLAKESRQENVGRGQEAQTHLLTDHRTALDELVAMGELDAAVADEVQVAFEAAVYHVWRSNALITCYEAVMVDYTPASSAQLVRQAALLTEIAETGDLDLGAVARVRAAIERDVAFLNLPDEDRTALYDEIASHIEGDGVPPFEQIDLAATPEASRAAQFLVDLLLKE